MPRKAELSAPCCYLCKTLPETLAGLNDINGGIPFFT